MAQGFSPVVNGLIVGAQGFSPVVNETRCHLTWPPSSTRSKPKGSTAGYSTIFTDRIPLPRASLGTANGAKMTTRRWFYLVPATGEPRGLVHAIERKTLDALPGEKTVYAGRQQLDAGLTKLLTGVKRVAMEYSRDCAIPYISRIDAGTIELVRSRGVDVESSGDLVQRFEAVWDEEALATHRDASAGALPREGSRVRADREARSRRRGDDGVCRSAADGRVVRRGRIDRAIRAPVVAAQENAGDPHYLPTARRTRQIRQGRARAAGPVGARRKTTRMRFMPILRGSGSPATTSRRDGPGVRGHPPGA